MYKYGVSRFNNRNIALSKHLGIPKECFDLSSSASISGDRRVSRRCGGI